MLAQSSLRFLTRLLDAPGPSGYELAVARVWRREAAKIGAVHADVTGNSYLVVNPEGSPTILLAGHIDEIGLIITGVDDDGFLYVEEIGGWDAAVLVGQRVRILGPNGLVPGVIGRKPIHLLDEDAEEDTTVPKVKDLWIDIGVKSAAEARELVHVGDAVVLDAAAQVLPNGRIVSRALDNRIGAFVVLEAARRYAEHPGAARLVVAANTQEEITTLGGGAFVCANTVAPKMAIVLDMTFATDHPTIERKDLGQHPLESGPVIARGGCNSPVVVRRLREIAARHKIPHTLVATGSSTGTDTEAVALARQGVATALVSLPVRYMHTPNEMASLVDVEHTIELLVATCQGIDRRTDFVPR